MIRGLLFDINGTVIDILTNEYCDDIYRVLGNLLDYQGVKLTPEEVRQLFFELNKRQRRASAEAFPELDAVAIFAEILDTYGTDYTRALPPDKRRVLPGLLAEVFRAASRFQLELYPGVPEVLTRLRGEYRMAAVSDAQSVWALPELWSVGLAGFFDPVIVSSDLGYRKPDARIFELALQQLGLPPSEVLFIGNDMFRDVEGAHAMGMKTVFFKSNQGDQKPRAVEPDYIIYQFSELPEAVRFLNRI